MLNFDQLHFPPFAKPGEKIQINALSNLLSTARICPTSLFLVYWFTFYILQDLNLASHLICMQDVKYKWLPLSQSPWRCYRETGGNLLANADYKMDCSDLNFNSAPDRIRMAPPLACAPIEEGEIGKCLARKLMVFYFLLNVHSMWIRRNRVDFSYFPRFICALCRRVGSRKIERYQYAKWVVLEAIRREPFILWVSLYVVWISN